MNRLIIPTSSADYGEISILQDMIICIDRLGNSSIKIHTKGQTNDVELQLAVAETGSNATFDALINACYKANPGGDVKVVLPEGQSITNILV